MDTPYTMIGLSFISLRSPVSVKTATFTTMLSDGGKL